MRTAHVILVNEIGIAQKEKYYLGVALVTAEKSDCPNRHGAVIVAGGSVVSKAANKFRNHPSVLSPEHVKSGCTVHAEVAALRLAEERGGCKGGTLFVARIGKFGPLLSRPCARCYDEIVRAGIKSIIHT